MTVEFTFSNKKIREISLIFFSDFFYLSCCFFCESVLRRSSVVFSFSVVLFRKLILLSRKVARLLFVSHILVIGSISLISMFTVSGDVSDGGSVRLGSLMLLFACC